MLSIGALSLEVINPVARPLHPLIDSICSSLGSLSIGGGPGFITSRARALEVRPREPSAHFRQGTNNHAGRNLDMTEYHDQVASLYRAFGDQNSTDNGDNNDDPRKSEYN